MPNIITHSLFAKEMADRFPDAGWLHAREHLFTVGSNGPDYLFFYGFGAGGPLKGATCTKAMSTRFMKARCARFDTRRIRRSART